ncbi:hypothetical protein V496_06635 [Pseudogymnoascus sp. VKM F-4515 (FW-2607)]|nr:hypothetical protein V496_06635 [Pseudogymnoascus sp. VKM F-4515 (FW-2607)]KFY92024.1 hypothetical protein V498_05193 [Pseudogymnoascus sp. VKM F-4517 (FW-2822)]
MATITDSAPAAAVQAPAKYSRYRSVRKANTAAMAPAPPAPASPNKPEGGIAQRSMSRYRRRGAAQDAQPAPLPTRTIPQGAIPQDHIGRRDDRTTHVPTPRSPSPPPTPLSPQEEEARLMRAHERTQAQRLERQKADEEEAHRILAEQKRKDLERLEITLAAAVAAPGPLSPPPVSGGSGGKFRIFGRKKSAAKVAATPPTSGGNGEVKTETRSTSDEMSGRRVEAATVNMDAPVSAVNAGERRVLIRFKQASINLPVTPTTTAQELIYSATNILSGSVAPDSAILRESYASAGLERRIRRYEHVRDIMNSWDRDTQNALVLSASDSPRHDTDLWPNSAPRRRPDQFSAQLQHSHKPGRWVKSYITLLPSGQLYAHRKSSGKLTDKDALALCHISDFDVYVPVAAQLRKLSPPKKHCCAIKSQQKATMFLSAENFVHFFCTDDAAAAEAFQTAIQRWRSWYLVSTIARATSTTSPASVPYTLGSFEPLALSIPSTTTSPAPTSNSADRQIPFHLRHSLLPPLATRDRDSPTTTTSPDATFSPTSLLGPTYSQRARQAAARDLVGGPMNSDFANGPFIAGPSLLNTATSPIDSAGSAGMGASSGLKRGLSTRSRAGTVGGGMSPADAPPVPGIPAPLLDFKTGFVEAPQWRGEGKGRGVEAPRGVPLVDVAGGGAGGAGGGLERSGTVFRR